MTRAIMEQAHRLLSMSITSDVVSTISVCNGSTVFVYSLCLTRHAPIPAKRVQELTHLTYLVDTTAPHLSSLLWLGRGMQNESHETRFVNPAHAARSTL